MTVKTYKYRGWTYHQVRRGHWQLRRVADQFTTWHQSHGGCLTFIRRHGHAPNPDQHYDDDEARLIAEATSYVDPDKL
jgi:hypothetical protein